MDPTAKARSKLDDIYRGLERPDDLAETTARALLDAAQARASGRPTPQAALVASGFSVSGPTIRGPSGTLAEITMGAEFGSSIYRQFHTRYSGGSWLFPTLYDPPGSVEDSQTDWLEDLLS